MVKPILFALFASLVVSSVSADSLSIQYKDGRTQQIPLDQPSPNIRGLQFSDGEGPGQVGIEGIHRIKAKHSGRCMDVAGVSTGNGANIQQWDCHGGDNQKWRFVDVGSGNYRIEALHSGRCVDVSGWGTGNGTNVQQWDCHGGDNQLWQLSRHPDGSYRIVSKHSNRCLDVAGVSTGNGANIYIWGCHDGDNQRWLIE